MVFCINQYMYYYRWYPFIEDPKRNQWWLNVETYDVIHNDEMKSIILTDNARKKLYIPMPRVDIVQMEKDFLNCENLHSVIHTLQKKEDDFDCEFKKYVDYNMLYDKWHKYEAERLQRVAIKWCEENNILYTLKTSSVFNWG